MRSSQDLPTSQKVMTMVGTLLGMLLAALDQTIVSTAGPAIQRDLGIEPALYAWLTTSYLVASVVMTPVWGKLSDQFGRRRILVSGIVVFLVGSLLCGLSQSTAQLIAARVVQGLGGAALFTTAFAVIADLFSPRERGRYTGLFGAVFGLSSVIGPLVGGLVTDTLGWHWCFLLNLPVGVLALGVIATRMPPLRQEGVERQIDVAGALTFALAIIPLLVALSLGKVELRSGDVGYPLDSPVIMGMTLASIAFFIVFVVVERRAKAPIIDLRLFANPAFSRGNLASFVVASGFLGAIVFLPLFMVNVVGASAIEAGLTTTPLTFGIVFGNIFAGQLSSRLGRYKFLIVGSLAVQMVGFAVMAFTLSADVTSVGMAARMVLLGLGLGPSIPLFNLHISSSVEPRHIGAATSTATLARSLGTTVGIAILGNVFGLTLAHRIESESAQATKGIPAAFLARLDRSSMPKGSVEDAPPEGGGFQVDRVRASVREQFQQQRATVTAALTRDDPVALQAWEKAPVQDERVRAIIAAGGLAPLVRAGFIDAEAKLRTALPEGPGALLASTDAASLPPALRDSLREELRERLRDAPSDRPLAPEATAALAGELHAWFEAASAQALQQARVDALQGALGALDAAEKEALAAVDRVNVALKTSFVDATRRVYFVGLFFVLAGLLVSLALPELPLRGRDGSAEGDRTSGGPAGQDQPHPTASSFD